MVAAGKALSAREARWLAIDAQGFRRPRPRQVGAEQVLATVRSLGAVQLDAINVVERTQFLVLFSRLGPFDLAIVHGLAAPGGSLWEYWGHAASLQPVEDEPLFRWRYDVGGTYNPGPKVKARIEAWRSATADYAATVLDEVRERGPISGAQLTDPRRRQGEWWERRSLGRQVLEGMFGRGVLSGWRAPTFEMVYDLPERVLPAKVRAEPTPAIEDAHRALLLKAARASGVATAADLAGYYMMPLKTAKARLSELIENGELLPVEVEGWSEPGHCVPNAHPRKPLRVGGTLVSPFDSLIWDRRRTSRLFGFDYRIEVYVPAVKRVHGYYVLPFLLGDELVGRFDLKADRKASVLRVLAAHVEPRAEDDAVADAALPELDLMRQWLGLRSLSVEPVGDLAPALRATAASR